MQSSLGLEESNYAPPCYFFNARTARIEIEILWRTLVMVPRKCPNDDLRRIWLRILGV